MDSGLSATCSPRRPISLGGTSPPDGNWSTTRGGGRGSALATLGGESGRGGVLAIILLSVGGNLPASDDRDLLLSADVVLDNVLDPGVLLPLLEGVALDLDLGLGDSLSTLDMGDG